VYNKDADIFYTDIKTGKTTRITETTETESNPQFSFNDMKVVYSRNQNLYAWNIVTGETQQLTNLKSGTASPATAPAPERSVVRQQNL
jgi:Tol biopolymer transport system component